MGSIMRRGKKYYLRYVEGYRPAVNSDGTPKLYQSGAKKGQPKIDAEGRPLLEPIERTRLARGATSMADAKPMLAAIEARLMKGELGIPEVTDEQIAQKTFTVRELGEAFYTRYSDPDLKNPVEYRAEAESIFTVRVFPRWRERSAASITLLDVERLRDDLTADGYAGASVTLTLATLSKAFTWARKQRLIDCPNPVKGCKRPKGTASLDFLSKDEVRALLEASERSAPDVHPMIATAIYTGMRKGELYAVRWTDVHIDAGRIDLRGETTKGGKPRSIPINAELAPILRRWQDAHPKNDLNLVFPVDGEQGTTYEMRGLAKLLKSAKCHVPAKPWHALRHTFASHFMMSGGNILTLQKLLGHSDIKMTLIYAHLSPDHLAAEVARMSFAARVAGVTDINEARRKKLLEALERDPSLLDRLEGIADGTATLQRVTPESGATVSAGNFASDSQ